MSYILYNINRNDCLGDAVAKINTNFNALDILACNIKTKSLLFEENQSKFKQLSAYIDQSAEYILQNFDKYNILTNTIEKLYTYWLGYQFTVVLPLHTFAPNITNITEYIRVSYLNTNYPAKNYSEYTIVNVINTNFTQKPKEGDLSAVDESFVLEIKELSHSIYRYILINNQWKYIETIFCEDPSCINKDVNCLSPVTRLDTASRITLNIERIQKQEGLTVIDVKAELLNLQVTPPSAVDFTSQ